MIAIHGLTIIAHHCSILITPGPQGNGGPGSQALRRRSGLRREKSRKAGNPGGRRLQMQSAGAYSRKTSLGMFLIAFAADREPELIKFTHREQGRAAGKGLT
jgi:hypothetical protein